ncbi:hypothetical protein RHMOL_Rhmol08G0328700 [Rhododendron molle]|uniref:Uncharacterized protein n=1 Tax=Rhododendron molle TaxID=49168 RepID=A0ACC0MUZ6_RHOML|nr:hypothetical protein RHMOL_Rhmol08G0328700 [Rhododendron molle]
MPCSKPSCGFTTCSQKSPSLFLLTTMTVNGVGFRIVLGLWMGHTCQLIPRQLTSHGIGQGRVRSLLMS